MIISIYRYLLNLRRRDLIQVFPYFVITIVRIHSITGITHDRYNEDIKHIDQLNFIYIPVPVCYYNVEPFLKGVEINLISIIYNLILSFKNSSRFVLLPV